MDEMVPEEIPEIRECVRRFMRTEVVPVLEDIAQAVVHLCSGAGRYVSGAYLVVDDGRNHNRAQMAPIQEGMGA